MKAFLITTSLVIGTAVAAESGWLVPLGIVPPAMRESAPIVNSAVPSAEPMSASKVDSLSDRTPASEGLPAED